MRWITFLLIASIALAGCSSGSDEPTTTASETTTTTATSSTTTATTTTSTTQPEPEENQTAPNTPPSATLSASITNGEAPVEVNFTLDGSDADGDDLTWTFDADEDGVFEAEGSELPAHVSFSYTEEGVFNATLTVSDGKNDTSRALMIDVTEAIAGPPESVTFTGSTQITAGPSYEQIGGQRCLSFLTGENEVDCLIFNFEDDYSGRAWETTTDGPQTYVDFWDVCDLADGTSLEKGTMASGTVPSGAGCVVIFANGLAPTGATMSITII